jgi:mitochondrial import receptor subunit TOM22
MVKVQIVDEAKDAGNESVYATTEGSRTSSSTSLSSVSSELNGDETVFDRIIALVDIVPPATRHAIAARVSKATSVVKRGGKLIGSFVWIVTTSAILVALPLALALEDEAKVMAQEQEMLAQQRGAQEVPLSTTFPHFCLNIKILQMLTPSGSIPVPIREGSDR